MNAFDGCRMIIDAVKAKAAGKAVITVKVRIAGTTYAKKVKVKVVSAGSFKRVKKITAKAVEPNLEVGGTTKIKVGFKPKAASNKNVTYKSNAPSVASVSSAGVVMAKKLGKAKIIVTSCDNPKAKASVPVTVAAKEPEVNPYEVDSDGDGFPNWVEETYMGTDPEVSDDTSSVENKTVYAPGVVRGEDSGAAVISATTSEDADYVSLIVSGGPAPGIGSVYIASPCDACPVGASVKVESVFDNGDGTLTVSGTRPDISEVIEYSHVSEELVPDWEHVEAAEGVTVTVSDTPLGTQSVDDEEPALTEQAAVKKQITFNFGKWGPDESFGDMRNNELWKDSDQVSGKIVVNVDSAHLEWDAYPVFKFDPLGAALGKWVRVGVNFKRIDVQMEGDAKLDFACTDKHSVDAFFSKAKGDSNELTIGRIPVIGGAGEGVYLKANLHLEKSGEVLVEYSVDYDADLHYREGGRPTIDPGFSNNSVQGQIKAQAKLGIACKAAVELFGREILTGAFEPGLAASVSFTAHSNPEMLCTDVGAWVYAKAYVELLNCVKWVEPKVSWDIWSEENSPKKLNWHWDGTTYVGGKEDCTWRAGEDDEPVYTPKYDFIKLFGASGLVEDSTKTGVDIGGLYVPRTVKDHRDYYGSAASIDLTTEPIYIYMATIPNTEFSIKYLGSTSGDESETKVIGVRGPLYELVDGIDANDYTDMTITEFASKLHPKNGELSVENLLLPNYLKTNMCGLCYLDGFSSVYFTEDGLRVISIDVDYNNWPNTAYVNAQTYVTVTNYLGMYQ